MNSPHSYRAGWSRYGKTKNDEATIREKKRVLCSACRGSGMGSYEGSRCWVCGGSGEKG